MEGDPIVLAILECLYEVTEYDPTYLLPEHRLITDLEMSQEQIRKFIEKISRRLQLRAEISADQLADYNLRQITGLIKASGAMVSRAA